ncbi:exo-alpha-sialidase [Arenibacter latericius]|uniref:exo-alpha-sialidase n=1 Tax=Arenibacter latericius TaxID=86104 RepID=UPI000685C0BE|nr:exo-alpha-sialidase [Arenibacter latericius]
MGKRIEGCDLNRRNFLKSTLIGGITIAFIPSHYNFKKENLGYLIDLQVPTKLFDGKSCWCHPRAGIVPGAGENSMPKVVMTMNKLNLEGSDVFYGMYGLNTNNLAKNWTKPQKLKTLAPRIELIDGVERPVALSDFSLKWHSATKTLLGLGHTVAYTPNWKVTNPRPRSTGYSVYDIRQGKWSDWRKLEMPDKVKFYNSGAGSVQRYDLKNGEILLPIYFNPEGKNSRVIVSRCSFDGKKLIYLSHGTELELNDETRGLGEPSLTKFKDDYFLTMRNDKKAYVARSKDGLHFDQYRPWKFDDGTELGSYNTQQHWITHSKALFLAYTRKGAGNDHVFRNRAPLFIGEVDSENLCVIRSTERILVPERGARLGNFGITDVSQNETWVTVSEWMQPEGVEKYGSDGSVFVAKIKWNYPNKLFV